MSVKKKSGICSRKGCGKRVENMELPSFSFGLEAVKKEHRFPGYFSALTRMSWETHDSCAFITGVFSMFWIRRLLLCIEPERRTLKVIKRTTTGCPNRSITAFLPQILGPRGPVDKMRKGLRSRPERPLWFPLEPSPL
jgi:hypothetical protein